MNTSVSPELDRLLLEKNIPMPVNPTIADVVMWLYEKHGIWIVCTPFYIAEGKRFSADVFSADNKKTSISHYKTPTEAYSFAIDYVLNNLI